MAKVISHVWSICRGSIAGITYTSNQYHSIIARQRVAPTNPGTNPQTYIRSSFTSAVASWLLLLPVYRAAWDAYARTLTYQGPEGSYQIPGREVFLGNIATRLYLSVTTCAIQEPLPTPPTIPGFLGLSVRPPGPPVAAGTGFSLTFDNPNNEDIVVYFELSSAYNPTRMKYYGPYLSDSLTCVPIEALSQVSVDVLGLVADMVYFVKVRSISDNAPIRMSAESKLRIVAQTTVAP